MELGTSRSATSSSADVSSHWPLDVWLSGLVTASFHPHLVTRSIYEEISMSPVRKAYLLPSRGRGDTAGRSLGLYLTVGNNGIGVQPLVRETV